MKFSVDCKDCVVDGKNDANIIVDINVAEVLNKFIDNFIDDYISDYVNTESIDTEELRESISDDGFMHMILSIKDSNINALKSDIRNYVKVALDRVMKEYEVGITVTRTYHLTHTVKAFDEEQALEIVQEMVNNDEFDIENDGYSDGMDEVDVEIL